MNSSMMIEMVGYAGSVLVVISMLMTSVVKLRVVNMTGAVIFTVYALLIRSYPTALLNAFLVVINSYNLWRLLKKERQYELIDGKTEEPYVCYVLDRYREDILKYFPEFHMNPAEVDIAYLICNDVSLAGIFLGKKTDKDTAEVILDYSMPVYRDCSVGTYLYARLPSEGIRRLVCEKAEEKHGAYLQKMGFTLENGRYVKEL